MDNRNKNVHTSGALGMLVRSGQIKKIENEDLDMHEKEPEKKSVSLFRTQSGVTFKENELVQINPENCVPWKYANRLDGDLGDINELIDSIKENNQLQPALVRIHPNITQNIKYEIIFGRRRWEACKQLKQPLLAIIKNFSDVQEAILVQEEENKIRKNISNYSSACHYKRLLEEKIFRTEKELADKLHLSKSKLRDLLVYTKIPKEIIKRLPDIHNLSNNMVIRLVNLLNEKPENLKKLIDCAHEIGNKIDSALKLETIINKKSKAKSMDLNKTVFTNKSGDKLFTFKFDHRRQPCIVINPNLEEKLDCTKLCQLVKDFIERNS